MVQSCKAGWRNLVVSRALMEVWKYELNSHKAEVFPNMAEQQRIHHLEIVNPRPRMERNILTSGNAKPLQSTANHIVRHESLRPSTMSSHVQREPCYSGNSTHLHSFHGSILQQNTVSIPSSVSLYFLSFPIVLPVRNAIPYN